jgi:Phage integrase family
MRRAKCSGRWLIRVARADAPSVEGVAPLPRRAAHGSQRQAGGRWQDNDLVFPSRVDTRWDASHVRREFRRIVEGAGLDPSAWTPRELRHSFVSDLKRAASSSRSQVHSSSRRAYLAAGQLGVSANVRGGPCKNSAIVTQLVTQWALISVPRPEPAPTGSARRYFSCQLHFTDHAVRSSGFQPGLAVPSALVEIVIGPLARNIPGIRDRPVCRPISGLLPCVPAPRGVAFTRS